MDWKEKAIKLLTDSLHPVPAELNELDWKSGLSDKSDRLAQHISAFANLKGGGFLVYGVNNDGSCFDMQKDEIDAIIQKLGNIAQNNLAYSIQIEHAIMVFEGKSLLFVRISEQPDKPVHLRGKDVYSSYQRSAGQTVKMSRRMVRTLIASSDGLSFEKQIAKSDLSLDEVLSLLNYEALYKILDKNLPSSTDTIIGKMSEYALCQKTGDLWNITNLGAILFARDLKMFPNMQGREVIVRKYVGTNNRQQEFEQHGMFGYAVGFEGLVDFIMKNTAKEQIEVKREAVPIYPRVAIREFVANALVHQDFDVEGMPVTIEIFSNRLTITNAGAPLNDINRLIDLPPQSRNEILAQTMFLLGICERRGSGIDRAVAAIEEMFLPAAKFTKSEQHTRVFLFPQKDIKEMTKQEKIDVCYQHACIVYEDGKPVNNQSVRERFGLNKNESAVASRILSDTMEAGLIKPADTETNSKKYMSYFPFYG
ncbi:MAG: putative DNA binding domain-containing protein [Salinivirgaceae bacterium]|nr:putative DNA binding domain-containing protein [Salinivirgaceae bacterium]